MGWAGRGDTYCKKRVRESGKEKGATAPLHVEVTVTATSGEAAAVRGDKERPQTAVAKLGRREAVAAWPHRGGGRSRESDGGSREADRCWDDGSRRATVAAWRCW
ncbi:dipeptide epimerase [Sesbania bispinosa]|nr:dipeptide epimerase [Sesbania bispinosa]